MKVRVTTKARWGYRGVNRSCSRKPFKREAPGQGLRPASPKEILLNHVGPLLKRRGPPERTLLLRLLVPPTGPNLKSRRELRCRITAGQI
jgi:hypothetical protein